MKNRSLNDANNWMQKRWLWALCEGGGLEKQLKHWSHAKRWRTQLRWRKFPQYLGPRFNSRSQSKEHAIRLHWMNAKRRSALESYSDSSGAVVSERLLTQLSQSIVCIVSPTTSTKSCFSRKFGKREPTWKRLPLIDLYSNEKKRKQLLSSNLSFVDAISDA